MEGELFVARMAEWLKTHRKHFAVCVNHRWTLRIWTMAKLALMDITDMDTVKVSSYRHYRYGHCQS